MNRNLDQSLAKDFYIWGGWSKRIKQLYFSILNILSTDFEEAVLLKRAWDFQDQIKTTSSQKIPLGIKFWFNWAVKEI